MAGSEIKEALRSAANTINRYIADAVTLTVETRTMEVGPDGAGKLTARTVITLDGDNTTTLPMQFAESGKVVVDQELHEIHMANVAAAIQYRKAMFDAMIGLLRDRV